jgi:Fic family protein
MMTIDEQLLKIDQRQQEIQALKPLNKAELQQLKEYYRISLTYSSNALEGNSLTESETKIVIEDGITIGGKPLKDHLEAVGHSEAFDLMYRLSTTQEITEEDILALHRMFYQKIDLENAGTYRRVRVFITGSTFKLPSPSRIKSLMQSFINRLPELRKQHHPVVYAALVHKEFVEIHPFIDGNGRVARLLMNLVLLQHGYPLVVIPPVIRSEYINALEACHQHDDTPFTRLIATAVIEAQKDFLRLFKDEY